MLFECSLVALIVCVIAALCVVGNRLGLWQSWLMCAAGAFTFVILLNVATTLSPFASGFIMAGLTALLRWLGNEHAATVVSEAKPTLPESFRTAAQEQAFYEKIFEAAER